MKIIGDFRQDSDGCRRVLFLCLILALLYLMLGMPSSLRATDCKYVSGIGPGKEAAHADCPTPPCKPNACSCPGGQGCGDTKTNAGIVGGCGPITVCVLLGSDPPLTNPQWDEPLQGFPNLATFISGKCPPWSGSGSSGGSGGSGNFLICPTTNNSVTR